MPQVHAAAVWQLCSTLKHAQNCQQGYAYLRHSATTINSVTECQGQRDCDGKVWPFGCFSPAQALKDKVKKYKSRNSALDAQALALQNQVLALTEVNDKLKHQLSVRHCASCI